MKALVFAAGVGSRLKPFTDHHPKALARVGGVPMLQRTILKLRDAGIDHVVVNVHHFAEQIRDFLAENHNFGMNISVSDETGLLLDTGGGLLKARNLLEPDADEPILLHNADILTDFPIGEMTERHESAHADVTLLINRRRSSRQLFFSSASGMLRGWENIKTGETRPEGFLPDDAACTAYAFGGVHIIRPTLFPHLRKFADLHGEVFSIIPFYLSHVGDLAITGYVPSRPFMWHDIGTPEKRQAAEEDLLSKAGISKTNC